VCSQQPSNKTRNLDAKRKMPAGCWKKKKGNGSELNERPPVGDRRGDVKRTTVVVSQKRRLLRRKQESVLLLLYFALRVKRKTTKTRKERRHGVELAGKKCCDLVRELETRPRHLLGDAWVPRQAGRYLGKAGKYVGVGKVSRVLLTVLPATAWIAWLERRQREGGTGWSES
jgi:hypothetical protein